MTTITSTDFSEPSVTNQNGTRYAFKGSGSQFGTGGQYTRSCLGCSKHKPTSTGIFRKVAGKTHFLCGEESCMKSLGLRPLPAETPAPTQGASS